MSIFYSDPAPGKSKTPETEITPQAALIAVGVMLAIAGYNKRGLVEAFYFRNFEAIYLGAYGAIIAMAVATIWQIKKRTKKLSLRMGLISFLFGNKNAIYVGRTEDGLSLSLPRRARLEVREV